MGSSIAWVTVAAYLCGSIPFGLMIVRAVAGVDLRTVGSGNIGATNVGRAAGKFWAIIVLLLDALKGAVPCLLSPWLLTAIGAEGLSPSTAQVLGGASAILGHMFPVWLAFRGGKGVATALGVAAVLAPLGTLVAAGAFFTVFAVKRIVSLSSLLAALAFGAFQMWQQQPTPLGGENAALGIFSLVMPLLIIGRHAGNIARLWRGTEAVYQTSREETPPGPTTDPTGERP